MRQRQRKGGRACVWGRGSTGSGEDSCPQGSAKATFGNLAETADHRVSEKLFQMLPSLGASRVRPAPPSCAGCLPREPVVRREGGGCSYLRVLPAGSKGTSS